MKKLKKYRGLLISLILALATVAIIHQYISSIEEEYQVADGPVDVEEQTSVIVAREDIMTGTTLEEEHLEVKSVLSDNLHPDAITEKSEVLGEVVVQDVVERELLLTQKILPEEEVNQLSHSIPENRRAISISVDEVSGVAGFIQAGDRVDVIATLFDQEHGEEVESQRILDSLKVLAVGGHVMYSDQDLVQEVSTVTLSVTTDEAINLTEADEEGEIRLLLRPVTESN